MHDTWNVICQPKPFTSRGEFLSYSVWRKHSAEGGFANCNRPSGPRLKDWYNIRNEFAYRCHLLEQLKFLPRRSVRPQTASVKQNLSKVCFIALLYINILSFVETFVRSTRWLLELSLIGWQKWRSTADVWTAQFNSFWITLDFLESLQFYSFSGPSLIKR